MGHAIATGIAAWFLVSGLCGAVCAVAVCVEDCDPCVSQCKCHHECKHGFLDSQTAHRLSGYRLAITDDPRGGVVRTISEIVGLSLDLADGPRRHSAEDFARFAEGVIEFNGLLLQPRRGTWTPKAVEVFDTAVVVPFENASVSARREGVETTLEFLFDRRGNLIQIDEVRPGNRPDPR
jgi:hypothetical protein